MAERNQLTSNAVPHHWREYGAADFTANPEGLSLLLDGYYPRLVVMKECGDLYAQCEDGLSTVLTGLPAWYPHQGYTARIMPGQTAAIIVYW